MNEPIDHHYVPRFYLSKWCGRDKKIHYFRWINGKLIHNRISPKHTGFETKLYSLKHVSANEEQEIEKVLRDEVDTPASRVLNKMIEKGVGVLSEEEKSSFTKFLISLRYRGPDSVTKLKSDGRDILLNSLAESQNEYEQLKESNDPSTFEEFFDTNLPSIPANLGLVTFVNWLNSTDMVNIIANMRWYIRTVKETSYDLLTSDNPLIYGEAQNSNKLYIGLPLSPMKMFFAFRSPKLEDAFRRVGDNKLVKHCNISTTNKAIDKIYATNENQKVFIKNHFKAKKDPVFS